MYASGKLAPEEGAGHSDGDTTSWAVPCCAAQHLPSQSPVCVCVRPAQRHLCFWFCLFSPNFHFHFLHPWGCWCHPLGFLSDIFMDSQVFYFFFFLRNNHGFPCHSPGCCGLCRPRLSARFSSGTVLCAPGHVRVSFPLARGLHLLLVSWSRSLSRGPGDTGLRSSVQVCFPCLE